MPAAAGTRCGAGRAHAGRLDHQPRRRPPGPRLAVAGRDRRRQWTRRRAHRLHPRVPPDLPRPHRPRRRRADRVRDDRRPRGRRTPEVASRTIADADGEPAMSVLSRPEPVVGYGGVGVTWDPSATADDEQLSFQVRTRTDGTWSRVAGPRVPRRPRPRPRLRRGTPAPGRAPTSCSSGASTTSRSGPTSEGIFPPAGMRMAVVAPGHAEETEREAPAHRHRRAPRRRGPRRWSRSRAPRWRRSPPSRRSTPAPSGAPTRTCATRARCATSRCTPASSTTP